MSAELRQEQTARTERDPLEIHRSQVGSHWGHFSPREAIGDRFQRPALVSSCFSGSSVAAGPFADLKVTSSSLVGRARHSQARRGLRVGPRRFGAMRTGGCGRGATSAHHGSARADAARAARSSSWGRGTSRRPPPPCRVRRAGRAPQRAAARARSKRARWNVMHVESAGISSTGSGFATSSGVMPAASAAGRSASRSKP